MTDTNSNQTGGEGFTSDIVKVVNTPASVAAWGAILCDVGVFMQTNATDSAMGWIMAGGSLLGTVCAVLIPALNKKRVIKK